ncbi:hypothetical protein BGX28_002213 [Mortierella sp. GBA30]|nr:hypothetical protein BGX28_002213 [Mortierella sp. GBA30]
MKPICQHLVLVLGLSVFVFVLFAFYAVRHEALDRLLTDYVSSMPARVPVPTNSTRRRAPKSEWDPAQKYLVYLPFEGISNQFYSFQNAATMAKRLNRTLVVPPITSNRHDRLGTNQPWSRYMDLERMSLHSGIKLVEWQNIKNIGPDMDNIIKTGSRTNIPKAWKTVAEPLTCEVIRNYGHDYFIGEEDSIGADFAYQYLLDLKPVPVPGYSLADTVSYVGDILDHNRNLTDPVVCFTFTFTAQFERGRNRWDVAWLEAGQYLRFLPRFTSYVEDLVAYRFGLLGEHTHPHPPLDLGTSLLDKGPQAGAFLEHKPPLQDYIAIHLRRGDIAVKCMNQTNGDCIVPLSEYKAHVDAILKSLPNDSEPPHVVLVSDTQSDEEKEEIDSYGWYRLDHAKDPNLLEAAKILGPFSPALIDSAVLTGRGARWVVGSRRSTMSWLTAMRIDGWYNRSIIYPKRTRAQIAQDQTNSADTSATTRRMDSRARMVHRIIERDLESEGVETWDRRERHYFDQLGFHH